MTNDKKEPLMDISTGWGKPIRGTVAEKVHHGYKISTIILAAIVLILGTTVVINSAKSELEITKQELLETKASLKECWKYNLSPNFVKPEGAI
jgi:hypothetical protein